MEFFIEFADKAIFNLLVEDEKSRSLLFKNLQEIFSRQTGIVSHHKFTNKVIGEQIVDYAPSKIKLLEEEGKISVTTSLPLDKAYQYHNEFFGEECLFKHDPQTEKFSFLVPSS